MSYVLIYEYHCLYPAECGFQWFSAEAINSPACPKCRNWSGSEPRLVDEQHVPDELLANLPTSHDGHSNERRM